MLLFQAEAHTARAGTVAASAVAFGLAGWLSSAAASLFVLVGRECWVDVA